MEKETEDNRVAEGQRQTEINVEVPVKVPKKPYEPTQLERDIHEASGHVPYRSWCSGCIASRCPDARHEGNSDDPQNPDYVVPTIEFDYATLHGKTSDTDSKIPFISASESVHGSVHANFILQKGSKDRYTMSALRNWIKSLGHPKAEIKCDQEASTIDVRNELIRTCNSTQLVPFATPKGSKGSLGQAERTHLTVGGLVRSMRYSLEDNINKFLEKQNPTRATSVQTNKWELGYEHVLNKWLPKHASFCTNVRQTKANGKTAYFSMRGREYNGKLLPFGEIGMFKVITDDKYENRWEKGVFVGKCPESDEFYYLTESGVGRSRDGKRIVEAERYDVAMLAKVKGTPWDPKGTSSDVGNHCQKASKDFTVAGNSIRRFYITQSMINEHGSTDGCPKCGAWGATHSAECIKRFEGILIKTGKAFEVVHSDVGNHGQNNAAVEISPESVALPSSSSSVPGSDSSSGSSGSSQTDGEQLVARCSFDDCRTLLAIACEPVSELWRDHRAWNQTNFPRDDLEKGRQK